MKQLSMFKDSKQSLVPNNNVYYSRFHAYFCCPYCDNMLSCSSSLWIKYCDECGKKLKWDTHTIDEKGNSNLRKEIIRKAKL